MQIKMRKGDPKAGRMAPDVAEGSASVEAAAAALGDGGTATGMDQVDLSNAVARLGLITAHGNANIGSSVYEKR